MRSFRNHLRRSVAPLAAAAVLAAAACTPAGDGLSIGIRRVSIDLTLGRGAERVHAPVAPPAPRIGPPGAPPPQIRIPDGAAPPPIASPCPAAAPGSVPPEPAAPGFRGSPAEGTYTMRNSGDARLEAGPLSITVPFPGRTPMRVSDTAPIAVEDPLRDPRTDYRFTVEEDLYPHRTATRLEITRNIVGRPVVRILAMSVTADGRELFQFRPLTPVTWIVLDPERPDWASLGVDYATGSIMTVEGSLTGSARLDLCGAVHEGWEIELRQRLFNPGTRFSYDDQQGKVSRLFVAPQLGGLVLAREVHATMTVPASIPLVYTIDYAGHLTAVRPVP